MSEKMSVDTVPLILEPANSLNGRTNIEGYKISRNSWKIKICPNVNFDTYWLKYLGNYYTEDENMR